MAWKTFETPPKDGQKLLYFDNDINGKIASGYYQNGSIVDETFQQIMHGATMWMDLPRLPTQNRKDN